MRIHTDENTWSNIMDAARAARVSIDRGESFRSRSRESGFDITLTGESRRRPNNGASHATKDPDAYAATWDQWGVFLGHLFNIDPDMIVGTPKRPIYRDATDFAWQTDYRFADGWPTDAHGDHTFRSNWTPGQKCTKCSAVRRWADYGMIGA